MVLPAKIEQTSDEGGTVQDVAVSTVRNCMITATIAEGPNASGLFGVSGAVGWMEAGALLERCSFSGVVNAPNSDFTGGLVGNIPRRCRSSF
jgi:hypothetical protein